MMTSPDMDAIMPSASRKFLRKAASMLSRLIASRALATLDDALLSDMGFTVKDMQAFETVKMKFNFGAGHPQPFCPCAVLGAEGLMQH